MGAVEETKISPPAVPAFVTASPLFGFVIVAVILFINLRGMPYFLLGFLAFDALMAGGMFVFLKRASNSPAYVLVRRDEFVVKRALKSEEETYRYADIVYFECRRQESSRVEIWETYGVRRDSPGHVTLPPLGGGGQMRSSSGKLIESTDIRAFRLLKAALESWQQAHGVIVEPRLADRGFGVLT